VTEEARAGEGKEGESALEPARYLNASCETVRTGKKKNDVLAIRIVLGQEEKEKENRAGNNNAVTCLVLDR